MRADQADLDRFTIDRARAREYLKAAVACMHHARNDKRSESHTVYADRKPRSSSWMYTEDMINLSHPTSIQTDRCLTLIKFCDTLHRLLKLPCSFDLGLGLAWAFLSHGGVRKRKRTLLNLRGPERPPKRCARSRNISCSESSRTIPHPQRLWDQSNQRPWGWLVISYRADDAAFQRVPYKHILHF